VKRKDVPVVITAAVEGAIDEAVARALVQESGGLLGAVHSKQGKARILQSVSGYQCAARFAPWLVLVDLDREFDCAPLLCRRWLPDAAPRLAFRVAVRSVEAWLCADTDSTFLGLPHARMGVEPESLPDPKRFVVDLARKSRKRDIVADLVPRDGRGRAVGPAYTARLVEFATRQWRPAEAAQRSSSLARARTAIRTLVESQQWCNCRTPRASRSRSIAGVPATAVRGRAASCA
jgi:hypothetical protein